MITCETIYNFINKLIIKLIKTLRCATKCDFLRFFILTVTNFTDLYERSKNLSSFLTRYISV